VGTGVARTLEDKIVILYQGDGDLAAIGTAEIMHAANRGKHLTVFFINNAIYGMTGGQMAPTTLLGQKTTTTPQGRKLETEGGPVHMCEILADLEVPVFLERVSLADVRSVLKAREWIVGHNVDRTDVHAVSVPATELARKTGFLKGANIIMLTVYILLSGVIRVETFKTIIPLSLKRKEFADINLQLVRIGQQFYEENLHNPGH
jgi:hypothetical protein